MDSTKTSGWQAITDPANGVFQFGYDTLNRMVSLSQPNGVADTLAYTPSDELLSRESTLGSLLVSRAAYDYDNFGRRISRTDVNGTSTFAYDDLGQLLSATYPAGSGLTGESYSYDLAGNRTSSAGAPAGAWVYDRNRLMQDGLATYTYDAEGNQITRTDRATGGVTRYAWNADHQLTSVRFPDGSSETFRYDPLGRRIEIAHGSQATRYSYDGPSIDAEYDAANALVATYLHGPTADSILESTRGGQRFYHHVDGLGSVTAITNQTGNVVARYVYDAFGNQRVTGSAVNPFTFTGRELDAATGLYYYRLRTYDPRIGRFLSEDPLPSSNPYPYVSNSPVNLIDPWGAERRGIRRQTLRTAEDRRCLSVSTSTLPVETTSEECQLRTISQPFRAPRRWAQPADPRRFALLEKSRNSPAIDSRVVEQTADPRVGGRICNEGHARPTRINSIANGGALADTPVASPRRSKTSMPILDRLKRYMTRANRNVTAAGGSMSLPRTSARSSFAFTPGRVFTTW